MENGVDQALFIFLTVSISINTGSSRIWSGAHTIYVPTLNLLVNNLFMFVGNASSIGLFSQGMNILLHG